MMKKLSNQRYVVKKHDDIDDYDDDDDEEDYNKESGDDDNDDYGPRDQVQRHNKKLSQSRSHERKRMEDDNDDDDVNNSIIKHFIVAGNTVTRNDVQQVTKLDELCKQLKDENKWLKSELRKARSRSRSGRLKKGDMITDYEWTGQEANLSERITSFCRDYLFPRYKFLKDGWEKYNPDRDDSLSSFIRRKLPDDRQQVDYEDQWERVYVPSIASKYKTLRCNLNNAIREQYKG